MVCCKIFSRRYYNSEIINVYLSAFILPVLISLCGSFTINLSTLTLISTKLEIFGTCKVSCLICLLNMLVLLGVFDSFDSAKIFLNVVGTQWYWMSCGADISNSYYLILGLCWTTFVAILIISPLGNIFILLGSVDVIHSLTLVYGICRADAVPGRLCSLIIINFVGGIFVGQCSELCGILRGSTTISLFI